jgi:DNA-binding GntR family transcriptional regulator
VAPQPATTTWLAALGDFANDGAHRTLAEKAFGSLHEAIVSGRLRPGERLPIDDIAESLEMSAMPIREAVRRLDAAGLAESIPHRGARVTNLSQADLIEVYEARLALEPLAVRHAAEHFDAQHARIAIERLAALNRLSGENLPDTWTAHTRFHFALYEAAGSQWLLRLIRPLWETSERYRIAVQHKLTARRGEHEEILAACVAHDPERAAAALHDHLAMTANSVSRAMGGENVFDRRRAFRETSAVSTPRHG